MKKATKKATTKWSDVKNEFVPSAERERGVSETFAVIGLLLRAAVEKYPDDSVAPVVVLAYIAGSTQFYGYVCRYFDGNKSVAYSIYDPDMQKVVKRLAEFIAGPSDTLRNKLREYI